MYKFIIIVAVIIVFLHHGNTALQVTHYNIKTNKLNHTSIKVLQISDFHDYKFNEDQIIAILNEQSPDIIVVTGDLIDRRRYNLEHSLSFIDLLYEYPVYYVTGNHEAWSGKTPHIVSELEHRGVTVLRNEVVTIEKDMESIQILGIDDLVFGNKTPIELSDDLSLLLSHRILMVNQYQADISFSGHAHGGQVRLFGRGLISPDQGWLPKRTHGVFENGSTMSVMSRGLGNSTVKLRIFNRPEIVIVTIEGINN